MRWTASVVAIFFFYALHGQSQCEFNYHQKRGAHYLFSTYFEDDWKTPKQGVCEMVYEGLAIERRVFKNGRLQEEIVRYPDGSPRIESIFHSPNKRDSLIVDQKVWWENKSLEQHNRYYLDETGRRCVHQQGFHLNGKLRFDCYYAFVRRDELNEYQVADHPDHVVDEDGYTTLMAPFGPERWFDETGAIVTFKTHRPILRDGKPYTYSLPLEYSQHGPAFMYHSNGKVQRSLNYVDGEMDGECATFYFDGSRESEGYYTHGVADRVWKSWYEDGSKKSVYQYDLSSNHPFHPSKQEWWPNGKMKWDESLDFSGSGILREWAENGQLIHEVDIKQTHRDAGVERRWFDNGHLQLLIDFRKDADTTWLEYANPEGQLKQLRVHVVEGKTTIIRQWEYHPNGTLGRYMERRTEDWAGNEQQWEMSQLEYRTTGVLSHNSWMTNRERCFEDYAENGIKVKSRRLLDNRLHGPYEELDSLGNMRLRCEYWEGLRHGWYREYNAQQELIVERLYQHGIPMPDAPEDYVKDVRQSLSREAKVWGREMVDRKSVDLDSAVTNAINREDLQIFMGRLYDGLLKPQWLSEIIELGDSGKFMGYQNMHVRVQCSFLSPGVLSFRIAGWGSSMQITMYKDGELEEHVRERSLMELSQHEWPMPKGMWWD